ncbi:hypothetical protein RRG08_039154 [Elysia crispata]|uniref:Nucleoside phosphorylase domain-containing protein n=1 Tax=Elysia crispata TaxID=231223 RepID=A0AAE1DYR4_9GAST|nr:hypothetical protein RRG08_039154 [Elysia crispata]
MAAHIATLAGDKHTRSADGYVKLPNPHLAGLRQDGLFHIKVPLDDHETLKEFSNVKFVCIGGTPGRVRLLAEKLSTELNLGKEKDTGDGPEHHFDFSFSTERYSGYKVGPVFCVNHGMGLPSVAILLHEVFKLLQAAGCSGVTLIRVGTCGGLGVEPGTVVVSSGSLTAGLKEVYVTSALGQPVELPVAVDQDLVKEISACASSAEGDDFKVKVGKTYCAEDFYQGQGRLDGSFCDYSKEDQLRFFNKLQSLGVCNIEMESAAVLAMAHKVGVKAAVVCVVLVDRLKCDLPLLTVEEMKRIENYPLQLIIRHIKKQLSKNS